MVTNIRPITPKPKPLKAPKSDKKTRRPKRVKKAAVRRSLERKADDLCKKIVLLRDSFCVCPAPKNGHSSVRQPGHLITRGKESVRWSLWNVAEQCSSCNLMHNFQPHRYTAWFVQNFGAGEYARLVADSEDVTKLSVDELEELCRQLADIYSLQLQAQTEGRLWKPRFTQKEILSGEWRYEVKVV